MGAFGVFAIGLRFARMLIGSGWMVWRILAAILFELNWVWMGTFGAFATGLSLARMLVGLGWMLLSGRVRWTLARCVSRNFSKGKNISHKWHGNLFWLLMVVCMRPHNCPVAQRLHMWGFSTINPSCPFEDFSKDCPLEGFGRVCPLEFSNDCPLELRTENGNVWLHSVLKLSNHKGEGGSESPKSWLRNTWMVSYQIPTDNLLII